MIYQKFLDRLGTYLFFWIINFSLARKRYSGANCSAQMLELFEFDKNDIRRLNVPKDLFAIRHTLGARRD